MLNYNHLHYFFMVGKLGSVSRAAESLRISQPSLSSQIKVLENQLKTKLFEKAGRGLRLSSKGQRVFQYCERMFEAGQDLENYLLDHTLLELQKIRIGVSDQIERPFVADLIAEISVDKSKKQTAMSVTTGSQNILIEQLQLKKIDGFLTNLPVNVEGLTELAMVDMPVCPFIAKEIYGNSNFKKNDSSFWQNLKDSGLGLVLPTENLKLRHETDIFLQKNKAKRPVIFESDILSVVCRAVMDGAGIGFLPTPFVAEELYHGLIVNVGPALGLWSHKLFLVVRTQDQQEDLLIELKDIILSLKQDAQFYKKRRKG